MVKKKEVSKKREALFIISNLLISIIAFSFLISLYTNNVSADPQVVINNNYGTGSQPPAGSTGQAGDYFQNFLAALIGNKNQPAVANSPATHRYTPPTVVSNAPKIVTNPQDGNQYFTSGNIYTTGQVPATQISGKTPGKSVTLNINDKNIESITKSATEATPIQAITQGKGMTLSNGKFYSYSDILGNKANIPFADVDKVKAQLTKDAFTNTNPAKMTFDYGGKTNTVDAEGNIASSTAASAPDVPGKILG